MPHRIIWSWYTGRWLVRCCIWYSEAETRRGRSPPRPLLTVPNVTAHPPTANVLLYNGPLLCGFNLPVKGLGWETTFVASLIYWHHELLVWTKMFDGWKCHIDVNDQPLMLSSAGTGSCAYESRVCRPGVMTSSAVSDVTRGLDEESLSPLSSLSALAVLEPDASWWPADASTSQVNVVDPARCLAAGSLHHPAGCVWTQTKYHSGDGPSRHCHDWTVDSWPSNIDDLLPTSETYKWMTIRRSKTKTGKLTPRRHFSSLLCFDFYAFVSPDWREAQCLPPVRSSVGPFVCLSACYHDILTRGQSNLTKSASRGPIPRLRVTPGGRNLYHWIPGVGFPICVP